MGPWHPEGTHRPEVPRGRSGQRGWRAWGPLSRGLCTAAEPTVTVSSALRPRGQQLRRSLEVQRRSPETRGCGNAAPPPHPLPLRQAGSSVASRDGEGRAGKDSSPGGPHLGLTQPEAPLRKVLPHAAGHRVARGSGTAPRRAVGTRTVAQGSRAQRGGPERGFALERKTEVATGGRGARWPGWPSPGVSASGHFSAGREVPTISAGCVPSTGCRGCTVSCPRGVGGGAGLPGPTRHHRGHRGDGSCPQPH